MLKALVDCGDRFKTDPVGYERADIQWVIEIGDSPGQADLKGPYGRGVLRKAIPKRGDRSGTVGEDNLKPALLVDTAKYALGITAMKVVNRSCREHEGFCQVARGAAQKTGDQEVSRIAEFLEEHWARGGCQIASEVKEKVKPKEIVAFRSGSVNFPFERWEIQRFWSDFLSRKYLGREGQCVVCARRAPMLRILPWEVKLFPDYCCPLASFNEESFRSFGKGQTENSPLCFDCASRASSALQFLAGSERHSRVLARDESKGGGKAPLRNQRAVFWLKDLPGTREGEVSIDWERLLAEPISAGTEGPPADVSQINALYALPFRRDDIGLRIAKTRFYLAVLSPNKSRLVVREWIDESLDRVCGALKAYDDARTVVSANGASLGRVPVQALLKAMRPWTSRDRPGTDDGDTVRGLLRTAYIGTRPSPDILHKAVRRFRTPVRPKPNEMEEFNTWRQAQAAAIKLVLTHGTQEAITLQSLSTEGRSRPHLCGQLLAVLEEAQLRASRWKINATLVDRFYGGASTSPSITLGWLLKQATQAHMPKVRREGLGYQNLEEKLESVQQGLDVLGGLPGTLTLREQGEFALGFYTRRAMFRAERAERKSAAAMGGK